MIRSLFIFPILALTLSSCGIVQKMNNMVDESTRAIHCNRQAVELSTRAIRRNIQAIEESNKAIAENKRQLDEINDSLSNMNEDD
ncbi:MAG: hypothetical protein VX777_05195 [Chlamydiota bacterium]|nr:hypothetical protein [Chlamydiota bacterium]